MSDIILYGHRDSGHACKVALALALAQIAHRAECVDIWAPPATRPKAFLAANPAAEVPVLLIDGTAHVQSGAILLEIAQRFGCLGGDRPEGVRRARELILWEANRIGMCLPQLVESRRAGGDVFTPQTVEWLRGRYDKDRARFDMLLGTEPFLHGAAPGAGDCAVFGYVQWVDKAGVEPTRAMAAWLDRMRDAAARVLPNGFFPAMTTA